MHKRNYVKVVLHTYWVMDDFSFFFPYFSLFLPWMSIMYFKKVKEMVTLKKMLTLTQTSYYSVLFFSFPWLQAAALTKDNLSVNTRQISSCFLPPAPITPCHGSLLSRLSIIWAAGQLQGPASHPRAEVSSRNTQSSELLPSTVSELSELKEEHHCFTIVFKTKETERSPREVLKSLNYWKINEHR